MNTDASRETPAQWPWAALGWAALAPGLAHVRARRPATGLLLTASLWAFAGYLVGGSHHVMHRPYWLLTLASLCVGLWLVGLIHAARLPAPRPLPWNVCLGIALGHWALWLALLLPPGIALVPTVPDLIRSQPTDQNAVTGAGGLTAGLSRSGVVTLLRWPGPAGRDHVDWRAAPGHEPGYGAVDGMGLGAGVHVDQATHWFRDPVFETTQRYDDDRGDVVITTHTAASLGLRAVETVFVDPTADVLVWDVALERLADGPDAVELVWWENLAPCTTRLPYVALSDWAYDAWNDWGAAYEPGERLIVHGRPDGDPRAPGGDDAAAWLDGLDAAHGAGVYFALGLADRHGWGGVLPADLAALVVGREQPGVQAAPAAGAVGCRVDLTAGAASAALILAAGPHVDGPDGARTRLRAARERGVDAHRQRARDDWEAWFQRARLPATDDPHVLALARRSLAVLRNAADRPSGAMVASVAAQLPYALDWARDGAFLNLALDEAGFPELVTRHNAYYVRVQRPDGLLAGTFPMNTYDDGAPGGPIFLEIDNAALAVWTFADHARFLEGAARADYLRAVWPALTRGADFLVRWRDPLTHLPLPAHEDDNPSPRRGIQGSVSAILALRAAEQAAAWRGEAPPPGWTVRRGELEAALFANFWDDAAGRLVDHGPKELDASAWALWPCAVFPPDDPRASRQADYLWAELQRTLQGDKARTGYDAKLVLALAAAWGPDHPRRPALIAAYRELAAKLPTPGTGLLGEHCRVVRGADGVRFENLNDMPHVWEHALHYLCALRLFPPS